MKNSVNQSTTEEENNGSLSTESNYIRLPVSYFDNLQKIYEETFDNELKKVERRLKKKLQSSENNSNNEIIKVKSEISKLKLDFIAVIGIFVSIFTFISIEIQLLKKLDNFFSIAGFSLIMASILAGFVVLTHFIFTREKTENSVPKIFWKLCFIPFVLGIILGSLPYYKFVINIFYIIIKK